MSDRSAVTSPTPEASAPSGEHRRVVIVGGVAGGMSAATRLRRLDPRATITVVERSGHVSYANCGLPYHVGGTIVERDELLLQTPESLRARFDLDVRVRTEATAIDPDRRTVTVRCLDDGTTSELDYDALILSPGAAPFLPPIPGIEHADVLRTVEDTDVLVAASAGASRAVIIGAGFIGVELAENLTEVGLDVTLVELDTQVLAPFDPEMAAPVADELRAHGVTLLLGLSASAIVARPDGTLTVTLTDGSTVDTDMVIAAIGVRPSTELARQAGLEVGPRGGIVVDDELRTSVPGIFAVGDATEKRDGSGAVLVPLANLANRQGRRVADVIAGRPARFGTVQTTAIVKVFGVTAASTGANEKRLRQRGQRFLAIHTHPSSHAGYYPGAETLSIKVLVDPDTHLLLGAQVVGRDGVDKRIDVLAVAMHAGLPVEDLADLELAYAPMFSSAKDPVNHLGYIAENRLGGSEPSIDWSELAALAGQVTVLDVRTVQEFADGAIEGALNIPVDELRERFAEVPSRGRVVVLCEVGQRAHTAVSLLRARGVDAAILDGGMRTWRAGRDAVR